MRREKEVYFLFMTKGPRRVQEDSFIVVRKNKGFLAVVADGMGGHKGGAIASGLATEAFRNEFLSSNGEAPAQILKNALTRAYTSIREQGKDMGTTATAVLATQSPGKLFVLWVGDSRAYLFRQGKVELADTQAVKVAETHNGTLFLLTEDDTYAWEAFKRKRYTLNDITADKGKNVLKASLHPALPLPLERKVKEFYAHPGDRVLLCTDGVWETFPSQALIADYLKGEKLKTAYKKLVSFLKQKEKEGELRDNSSFVLFEYSKELFMEVENG